MNKKQTFFHPLFLFLSFFAAANIIGQVENYNWPETIPKSDKYSVKIISNGEIQDVFTHICLPRTEAGPDGLGINGELLDRTFSFVEFSFDGGIIVEVTKLFGESADRVEISPRGYGINPFYFDGKTVKFELDRWRYVSVNFVSSDNIDSYDVKHSLMIFADSLERYGPYSFGGNVVEYYPGVDTKFADVIYFPPGDHDLRKTYPNGRMPITKPGQKVYIAGGAYVRGSIDGNGRNNVWLYGRGIINGRDFVWHELGKIPFIDFMGADYVHIEGISVTQAFHHAIPSGNNSYIKNLKIFGWCFNNDGIRPSGNSYVEGIFIKTMDDYDYVRDEHTVVNSVFWPMRNGAVGQLGWNDLGNGKTTYKNNYYIYGEWPNYRRNRGIVGSVMNQGTNLGNNTFENLYLEDNQMFCNVTMEYDESAGAIDPNDVGLIYGFTFRNIKVEKDNFYSHSGNIIKNKIAGFVKDGHTAVVRDFKFINLVVGNTIVSQENHTDYFDIDAATTSNIQFLTEGNFYTVSASAGSNGNLLPSGDIPVPEGMDQSIKIVPDNGYKISKLIVDGEEIQRKQHYLFQEVNSDHQISVEFEPGDDYFDLPFNKGYGINIEYENLDNGDYISQDSLLALTILSQSLYNEILKIELFLNDTLVSSDSLAPFLFELQDLQIGQNSLTAKAYDAEGNYSTKSVSFTVFIPDTEEPQIKFISPAQNEKFFFGDSILLHALNYDNINLISARVTLDDEMIFENSELTTDSLIFTGKVGELETGIHNLSIELVDQANLYSADSVVFEILDILPANYLGAEYNFENNYDDESGNERDGTKIGGPEFIYARGGEVISFDGEDDAFEIPQFLDDHFTVSFHIRASNTAPEGGWGIVDGQSESEKDDFSIYLKNDFVGMKIGNPDSEILGTKIITDGKWHHVMLARHASTGNVSIYIDGLTDVSGELPTGNKNSAPKMRVGSFLNGSGFLNADIDELIFYNAPLTADAVPIISGKIPAPWSSRDIGSAIENGFSKYKDAIFTLASSDSGFSGNKDNLHYVYRLLPGNINLMCKIEDITNAGSATSAGIMVRQSLSEGGTYAAILLNIGNGSFEFRSRSVRDGLPQSSSIDSNIPEIVPKWLRLERLGDSFYGYVSNDTLSWTLIGSVGIDMSTYVYAGLAVSSGAIENESAAIFSNVILSDIPVDVENEKDNIPAEYELYQNYPNPFNPATNIKFALPESGKVTLKVFDIIGREVAVLVDQILKPGVFNLKWNAQNLSSGIYFYSIKTEKYSEVKKMLLIK